jgi:hypothetical protein
MSSNNSKLEETFYNYNQILKNSSKGQNGVSYPSDTNTQSKGSSTNPHVAREMIIEQGNGSQIIIIFDLKSRPL